MAVPPEIRSVRRPINTTVMKTSDRAGPRQYAVRSRLKPVYRPGKTPLPRNGPVIGHIWEGRFVPLTRLTFNFTPKILSYGSAALIHSVQEDILADLCAAFPIKVAAGIITIAGLRIIKPGITDCRLATAYRESFLSRFCPGVALSANTVTGLLQQIGDNPAAQKLFFRQRLQKVLGSEHIAVDGTLKQDSSRVNNISSYSGRARLKGCRQISILYAFDIERREPICAQVFPGRCTDASAYRAFIRDHELSRGIILADKGFPRVRIRAELHDWPDLHFMSPIKRNSRRITELNLTAYDDVLEGDYGPVMYAKRQDAQGFFLYGFKDEKRAAMERRVYLEQRRIKRNFDFAELSRRQERFGTITIESDRDLEPRVVYRCYADRWLLELVFRHYKNTVALNETRVQSDNAVYGTEFINFVTTLLTMRIMRKAEDAGLLAHMTFGNLMEDLTGLQRDADAPLTGKYDVNDGWVYATQKAMDEMVALGLIAAPPRVSDKPRKRGRPRKNPSPPPSITSQETPCETDSRPQIDPM